MIEYICPKYIPRWFYPEPAIRPPGYYFYDETSTQCCGPYETKEQCQTALNAYALSLEPRNI